MSSISVYTLMSTKHRHSEVHHALYEATTGLRFLMIFFF